MHILKIAQSYYPFQEKGGPVFKVRALARGLVRRGHRVTVLTADWGLQGAKQPGMNIERLPGGWRWFEGDIETIYLDTAAHYRATTLNPSIFAFCSTRIEQFDMAHFYGLYDLLGPSVSRSCRKYQIPYVIEPMGMYRPIDRSFRLKRLWHRTLGSTFLSGAQRMIVTSEMEQNELADSGVPTEKLVLRYNGIDSELHSMVVASGTFRGKHGIPSAEPLILFLSRLIPRKGADRLIEAFAKVCAQSGWLVIAGPEGEPGYRSYLEACAEKSGVQARILFVGPLYDEEKKAALIDADIFALPSRYENFANVAAEATACGVPVIVTRSCGMAALVENQAGLVIETDRNELADALQRMIYDKVLYSKLKAGCCQVADRLNWDHLAEQMEDCYINASGSAAGVAEGAHPAILRTRLGP